MIDLLTKFIFTDDEYKERRMYRLNEWDIEVRYLKFDDNSMITYCLSLLFSIILVIIVPAFCSDDFRSFTRFQLRVKGHGHNVYVARD